MLRIAAGTETIKPVSGASTKEAVKTIAQGRPDRSGEPVVTTRMLSAFAYEAAGASDARFSLRPLLRERSCITRTDRVAGMQICISHVSFCRPCERRDP